MLGTTMDLPVGLQRERRRLAVVTRDPLVLAIAVLTLLGLVLRLIYVLHSGFVTEVTEYDDGAYFGSAVRLTHGILPYRDFFLVHPPGITLLMVPSALLAKVIGTSGGLVSGRVLEALAGTASIPLTGLLVRHRGLLATVIACGLMAVYPEAIAASHTVLLEPWLVLFTVLGAVLLFDGDQLTARRRRLIFAGVAIGFAGAVEVYAIIPAAVLLGICLLAPAGSADLSRWKRTLTVAGGMAAGFLVPVAPLALTAPTKFYESIFLAQSAQIGHHKLTVPRVGLSDRLYKLAGLGDLHVSGQDAHFSFLFHLAVPLKVLIVLVILILIPIVVGIPAWLMISRRHYPTPLEWYALASTGLVLAMFMWPSEFYYHFAAFMVPFLAPAIALPLARLAQPDTAEPEPESDAEPVSKPASEPLSPVGWLRGNWAIATVALVIVLFSTYQAKDESGVAPSLPSQVITQAQRLIPPGSCVVSDTATLLLLADRFSSSAPGCTVMVDGLGTDLALSHGLTPETGAGAVPAVTSVWRQAIGHAQYLWLTAEYTRRIPVTPALASYMKQCFQTIDTDAYGDTILRRTKACGS